MSRPYMKCRWHREWKFAHFLRKMAVFRCFGGSIKQNQGGTSGSLSETQMAVADRSGLGKEKDMLYAGVDLGTSAVKLL